MGKTTFSPQEYSRHPFLLSSEEVFTQLETNNDTGLSELQAQQAQQRYGANKLDGDKGVQWHSVLIRQISNAMILVSPT